MRKPKILMYDIETSHNLLAGFDLAKYGVPYTNIIQEWFMICAAWKWYGQQKVNAISILDAPERFEADHTDDLVVVTKLHEVISQADAIVAHYGDGFDIKKLNARLAFWGFDPLPPVIQVDTWKIANAKFRFNSNKLDYLAKYFGFPGKVETTPGLWLDVLAGKKSAIREMVRYNKQDVVTLEQVFDKLRPFAPAKVNQMLFTDRAVCPSCGSAHIQYRGFAYTRLRKYRRFQCVECGHWDRERRAVKD